MFIYTSHTWYMDIWNTKFVYLVHPKPRRLPAYNRATQISIDVFHSVVQLCSDHLGTKPKS